MDLTQAADAHVGIDLGRVDPRVAEEFLEGSQVGPVFRHQRGGRVTQQVAAESRLESFATANVS